MTPLFMKFLLKGTTDQYAWINMNHVAHITSDGAGGSTMIFPVAIDNYSAHLVVVESPEEIGKRAEWN